LHNNQRVHGRNCKNQGLKLNSAILSQDGGLISFNPRVTLQNRLDEGVF
jgi:hypothetical protein